MNKRIFLSLLATVAILTAFAAPAHALLSVSGHYAGFNGGKSGFGGELSLPLLPITIGATYIENTYTSIPSFGSFGGGSLTGAIIPIYASIKLGVPMIPIYAALEGGYTLGTATSGSTTLPIPGGVYYSVAGGYSMPITPGISVWGQVGYSNLMIDLKSAVTAAGGSSALVTNLDFSGMTYKFGATLGL